MSLFTGDPASPLFFAGETLLDLRSSERSERSPRDLDRDRDLLSFDLERERDRESLRSSRFIDTDRERESRFLSPGDRESRFLSPGERESRFRSTGDLDSRLGERERDLDMSLSRDLWL